MVLVGCVIGLNQRVRPRLVAARDHIVMWVPLSTPYVWSAAPATVGSVTNAATAAPMANPIVLFESRINSSHFLLVRRDIDIGLCDGCEVGVGFQIRGQVGEKARLHEIGRLDEVEPHSVGNLVRLNADGELGGHLDVGDRSQLDLVGMGPIPEVGQARGGVGAAGAPT